MVTDIHAGMLNAGKPIVYEVEKTGLWGEARTGASSCCHQ